MTNVQPLFSSQDPLWFKQAIIYEVPVRAFADSNADGIGDFPGLTEKLDYLQDLGITAIWLLPFFPSPLKDDGYDIADYTNVNEIYGSLSDFKDFLTAAHARNLRVIIELIVNHTSDQHAWFQRARRSPAGSTERDFYVWSDTPKKYEEARIIFQDFETSNWAWDPVAQAYYWHRFYSHQPDLNYDHPAVRQAVFRVVDFWLGMGVDGLRLDAVPYLYERDGTNCENLPETHVFLKSLREYIDDRYPDRLLLAEANQWPEDAAAYYGDGDECHMNFHFPLMPRLFMAVRMEDNFPIIDILQQTPAIPHNCQWGIFLRNHDELTLEMVTDEDRDYMYRVYAQDPEMRINLGIRRRLAPLLGNDRRQIELLHHLLLSLPGTPVLYYGDEIGMGENVYLGDRNGVRTPMQWSPDRNAGFSRTSPHKLYLPLIIESEYHFEAVNVEAQRANPHSLWYSIKRLIATRQRFQAFGLGAFDLLHPENRKVLAFIRSHEDEHILVVANLSRFLQTVELDLSNFAGQVPVEIYGRTEFPTIGKDNYFLSIGPYGCYWFILKPQTTGMQSPQRQEPPCLRLPQPWPKAFQRHELEPALEAGLVNYLQSYSWFEHRPQSLRVTEVMPLGEHTEAQMIWLQVQPFEGESQTYLMIVSRAIEEAAMELLTHAPQAVIARLKHGSEDCSIDEVDILFDAMAPNVGRGTPLVQEIFMPLLQTMAQRQGIKGLAGEVIATVTDQFPDLEPEALAQLPAVPLREEHRNSSIVFNEHLLLKLFRKQEAGTNPDLEIRRFLSDRHFSQHIAPLAGALEYHRPSSGTIAIGLLQTYIPDVRSSWKYTLDSLRDFFEYVLTHQAEAAPVPVPPQPLLELQASQPSALVNKTIGAYLADVELLGTSTADLHLVLASDTTHASFAPEPFSTLYQRSIYQSARNLTGQTLRYLQQQLPTLPDPLRPLAQDLLHQRDIILDHFQRILTQKITALRIRCHGDFHLKQVLHSGKDFVIIDFEGDPALTLNERRLKRSALRDVVEMVQSFGFAAEVALRREIESGILRSEQIPTMHEWSQFWTRWVSAVFLRSYLAGASQGQFLPRTQQELGVLLNVYLLERAIYSLAYELKQRPEGIEIALRQVLKILRSPDFQANGQVEEPRTPGSLI